MGAAHSTVDACGLCHVRPEKDLFKRSHEHVLPTCNSSPFSPPNSSPFSPLCARGCAYRESKEEDIVMEQGFAPLYDLTLRDMTTKQLLAIRRELATRSRSLTSVENTAEQRHIVADLRSVQSILPTILFDDLEAQAVVRGGIGHNRAPYTYPELPCELRPCARANDPQASRVQQGRCLRARPSSTRSSNRRSHVLMPPA